MDRNQLINQLVKDRFNFDPFARPTLNGELIWDGTYHGDTDPVGPIGGTRDISNGF